MALVECGQTRRVGGAVRVVDLNVFGTKALARMGVAWLFLVLVIGTETACDSDPCPTEPPDTSLNCKPGPNANYVPAWSPDGNRIAFVDFRRDETTPIEGLESIKIIDLRTREITTIREGDDFSPSTLDWSPDGQWLVSSGPAGIHKLSADGGTLIQLKSGEYHFSACWSTVTDRIFFGINGGSEGGIYSILPDGSDLSRITFREELNVESPTCFSGTDSLLVLHYPDSGGTCLSLYHPGDDFATETLICDEGDLQVSHWTRVSPNGRFVAFAGATTQRAGTDLNLFDRSDRSIRVLAERIHGSLDYSPGGRQIVFTDLCSTNGLQLVDTEAGQVEQLTRPNE